MKAVIASSLALAASASAYVTGVDPWHPPHHSESGQSGYNDCGTHDSKTSQCQSAWINSAEDFCFFGPPDRDTVGDIERVAITYCTKAGHGARLVPSGTFKNVHFVSTPHYIQITATGDFTKINVRKGDEGGELDPHGYDGKGNPIGGLMFGLKNGNGAAEQFDNWTEFLSDSEFCLRVCHNGDQAGEYCQHIYDVMGCRWNMPGNYGSGFDQCQGSDVPWPMGLYDNHHGGTSTWYQGVKPTPGAGKAGKTSECKKVASLKGASYPNSKRALDAAPTPDVAAVEKRHVGSARRHGKKAL